MNLLLDTHAFIWFVNGDQNLSPRAGKEILEPGNNKFISIVSIWEIAIKTSLGKLKLTQPFEEVIHQVNDNGFEILPVVFEHTLLVNRLEFHHRDPFDRLIIAQAMHEELVIVTRDKNFNNYDAKTLW